MFNKHRSTDWRHRQARAIRNDLVMAFSEAATRQEVDIVQPAMHEITNLDADYRSDTDTSISFDQEMESPIEKDSEPIKKKDQNQATSIFESSMLYEEQAGVELYPIDIATALIALKSKHHLSNSCIEDILALLHILNINIPSSYKALCTLLRKRSSAHLSPSTHTICPHCQCLSSETHQCTTCGVNYAPILPSNIPLFYTYDIFPQLKAILAISQDLLLQNNSTFSKKEMKDIIDGNVYKKLIENEPGPFITLTLNVDGIQPNKGSDQSLWPVLLVINEIHRKKRYSLENSIIAGMWPGPSKPSRIQMSLLFKNIVSELQELEQGHLFELYASEHNHHSEIIKVFLIGACCDKPAQCLIQCLAEPTAFFGCGRCEIQGISVPTKKSGSIVSFAICENDQPACERTNERHDLLLEQLRRNEIELAGFTSYRGRAALIQTHKDTEKGVKGPCILRTLSKFDVGHSFLVDSLHNIYLGLFKKLLSLWLSHQNKDEDWSIWSHTKELATLLSRFRFPSTTTRHPRPLHKFAKYKGNEIRLVLLFGYSIFENILKAKYYSHLLLLVLAVHHAESRCLTYDMIDVVETLCRSFLLEFPKLYSSRHNVQVVHSISHLSETLRSFGPLSTYSTFNFENQLGLLTRSCKSTRRHAIEIMNNIMYLRDAFFQVINTDMHSGLRKLTSSWLNISSSESFSSKDCVRALHPVKITDQFFNSIFSGDIIYYSTAFIGGVRFTTAQYARNKVSDDSSIIFKTGLEESFGRIRRIFTVSGAEPMFYVDVISVMADFECATTTNIYTYSHIQTGSFDEETNSVFISASDIVEKCVFYERNNKVCTFYKFPTLEASS